MNQQQLQIARAALWHQTAATDPSAPLRTVDDAARFLDELGFCLFLPHHTQLAAPAPSFVEACLGAPSATPAPAAIFTATELSTRLIAERRLIPLNLLGAFSEQPDFLVTVDILPWVAAMRGDRQWKSAPAGRTAPIVVRTWEALDREGEKSAIELRELLGRELTEAAVLRALIELWTSLRAMPVYAPGQPTLWTLLKNRFPAQLATASNTAQTTALSAILSLYLRSAIAASAEEAEIFLSPLTARSRIREVLHGMMATRQLATTTVASQTLLFVEGSLPETLSAPEPEARPAATPAPPAPAPRPPFRKQPSPTRWELPSREARPQPDRSRPWQKKPAVPHRPEPAAGRQPDRRDEPGRPFRGPRIDSRPNPRTAPASGPRPGPRGERTAARPWQRRPQTPFRKPEFRGPKFRRPDAEPSAERSKRAFRPPRDPKGRGKTAAQPRIPGNRPWQKNRPGRDQRPSDRARPVVTQRSDRDASARADSRRPNRKFGARPAFGRSRPTGPGQSASGQPHPGGTARPFRPGKFSSGKSTRPPNRGARTARPGAPKNKFRKPAPTGRNPRKNRSQKEDPE